MAFRHARQSSLPHRPEMIAPKLHWLEQILMVLLGGHLIFLPWALDGRTLWGQTVSCGLGGVELILALIPRTYDGSNSHLSSSHRLYTWPKLLKFPPFWLGLILLGYMLVQAMNPAWAYATDGKSWRMVALWHHSSLPSGVRAPLELGGSWRSLLFYTPVWASLCAAWIGITRRRAMMILFATIASNGFVLAVLGIAEKMTNADKIFWLWKPPARSFIASFTYKNNAGAYFDLIFALTAGLAFWYRDRTIRRHKRSGPTGIFIFFMMTLVIVVFMSLSRTSMLLMLVYLSFLFGFVIKRHINGIDRNSPMMVAILVVAVGIGAVMGIRVVGVDHFIDHLEDLRRQIEIAAPGGRTLARRATWEMARLRLWYGWGAGSFRFIFPTFQVRYPSIYVNPTGNPFLWRHAYNDYFEILAELGILGVSLCLGALAWAVSQFIKIRAWRNPLACCLLTGCGVTLLHSTVDFNFYCAAILNTWWLAVFMAIRWVDLDPIQSN